MTTRTMRLTYPPSLLRSPIINQLIRRFDIAINIISAHITLEKGWLEIEVAGSIENIDDAASWLRAEGIEVMQVG
jgi:ABC-type methionine transport system ATPase subunit